MLLPLPALIPSVWLADPNKTKFGGLVIELVTVGLPEVTILNPVAYDHVIVPTVGPDMLMSKHFA